MAICQLQGFLCQIRCFFGVAQTAVQDCREGQGVSKAVGMAELPRKCKCLCASALCLVRKAEKPQNPRVV